MRYSHANKKNENEELDVWPKIEEKQEFNLKQLVSHFVLHLRS